MALGAASFRVSLVVEFSLGLPFHYTSFVLIFVPLRQAYVVQAGFQLVVQPKKALELPMPPQYWDTGVHHYAQFTQCWGLRPGLHAC